MGKKINYESLIRARVSKEERDFIHQYAKDNNTDISKLIREFINGLR